MTNPDRLAAAVAQGHEDAVQAWPQEDADPRPAACCGKCPPIVGGGYDCTCEGNPRCVASAVTTLEVELGRLRSHPQDDLTRRNIREHETAIRRLAAPVSPPTADDTQPRAGAAEVAAEILTYHCRIGSRSCRECGDLPLGSSFTQHLADALAAASLLRQDPPQVAGEDPQAEVDAMRFYSVENGDFDSDEPAGEDVERVARALFITEAGCDDPATAERLWSNLTSRMPVTEWHRQAEEVLAALSARPQTEDMERVAREEARRRLDSRWTATPHPDLTNLPEGEGRAYIFGFERGVHFAALSARPVEAQRDGPSPESTLHGLLNGAQEVERLRAELDQERVRWAEAHLALTAALARAEAAEALVREAARDCTCPVRDRIDGEVKP